MLKMHELMPTQVRIAGTENTAVYDFALGNTGRTLGVENENQLMIMEDDYSKIYFFQL